MTWLMLVGLVVLLALNVPVAYAMLGVSILYLVLRQDIPLIVVAQQVAAGTDKFLLLAIPFFFLAAELMSSGGVMQRLVDFARALVGHLRGGLGQVNVVSSMLFAGMTGSAVADAADQGVIEVEMMRRAGYDVGFSAASPAPRDIGPIIPPSIPLSSTAASPGVRGASCSSPDRARLPMGLFLMASVWWIAGRRKLPRYRGRVGRRVRSTFLCRCWCCRWSSSAASSVACSRRPSRPIIAAGYALLGLHPRAAAARRPRAILSGAPTLAHHADRR